MPPRHLSEAPAADPRYLSPEFSRPSVSETPSAPVSYAPGSCKDCIRAEKWVPPVPRRSFCRFAPRAGILATGSAQRKGSSRSPDRLLAPRTAEEASATLRPETECPSPAAGTGAAPAGGAASAPTGPRGSLAAPRSERGQLPQHSLPTAPEGRAPSGPITVPHEPTRQGKRAAAGAGLAWPGRSATSLADGGRRSPLKTPRVPGGLGQRVRLPPS